MIYAKVNAGLASLTEEPGMHQARPVNVLLRFKRWFSNGAAEATCPHCQDAIPLTEWAETWYQGEPKSPG